MCGYIHNTPFSHRHSDTDSHNDTDTDKHTQPDVRRTIYSVAQNSEVTDNKSIRCIKIVGKK
jgi:hypothetical protein